jgi:selenoprotein W-related protein
MKPCVTITYCTGCNWLLRARWVAQELLQTFGPGLGRVTIVPGDGGIFRVGPENETIRDRARDGGFPYARILKQMIRQAAFPGRPPGHIDRTAGADGET